MKPAAIINRFLSSFGVSLVRRSSLERLLVGTVHTISVPSADSSVERKEISRTDFDSLASKIDGLQQALLRQQISSKWDIVDYLERLVPAISSVMACPLCGHKAPTETYQIFESQCIFGGGRLTRFQCSNCDVIFGPQKMFAMNAAELAQDYESHYKVFQEGDSTEQEIRAFHLLKPRKDGIYLNYGAGGWSKSVQILREQGWNVFAFEPHDSAVSNLDHLIKSKSDLLKMQFDGVFSNNVLEHLRYPVDELSFIKKIMKPNARMSHATPCFEYLYEYTRFHLFFFLGRSRTLIAEKSGLAVIDFVVDNEFMCASYVVANQ